MNQKCRPQLKQHTQLADLQGTKHTCSHLYWLESASVRVYELSTMKCTYTKTDTHTLPTGSHSCKMVTKQCIEQNKVNAKANKQTDKSIEQGISNAQVQP